MESVRGQLDVEELKRAEAEAEMLLPHVLVIGDLLSGFELIGPFNDMAAALQWGDINLEEPWVAMAIQPTEEMPMVPAPRAQPDAPAPESREAFRTRVLQALHTVDRRDYRGRLLDVLAESAIRGEFARQGSLPPGSEDGPS